MITFIRHGQTHNNIGNKDEKDTRLTEKGKDMCMHLHGHYELVICSTLWRTRETLEYSNITYDNLIYTDLCREKMNGSLDNYRIREEVEPETKEEFLYRCRQFQELLLTLSQVYSSICVISHSGTLTKLLRKKFKNAQVHHTDIDSYIDEYLIELEDEY